LITLVLGGTRSGKSALAERLAAKLPQPVTYVATIRVEDDDDLAARVAAHRARRPAAWRTEEVGEDLPAVVRKLCGSILLDALGGWVATCGSDEIDADALCSALGERDGDSVVVSEEVGMGVHPSTETGRRFRDALGSLNQSVAEAADEVILVVAGRPLHLGEAP
jgi:adenosyl cobinamide kinase/adenosyl cobinamide phosphate guanylyltransferase